jgi:hypothetical protein
VHETFLGLRNKLGHAPNVQAVPYVFGMLPLYSCVNFDDLEPCSKHSTTNHSEGAKPNRPQRDWQSSESVQLVLLYAARSTR